MNFLHTSARNRFNTIRYDTLRYMYSGEKLMGSQFHSLYRIKLDYNKKD